MLSGHYIHGRRFNEIKPLKGLIMAIYGCSKGMLVFNITPSNNLTLTIFFLVNQSALKMELLLICSKVVKAVHVIISKTWVGERLNVNGLLQNSNSEKVQTW